MAVKERVTKGRGRGVKAGFTRGPSSDCPEISLKIENMIKLDGYSSSVDRFCWIGNDSLKTIQYLIFLERLSNPRMLIQNHFQLIILV